MKAAAKGDRRRVFFVHIPKCAGTTVSHLMRYQFGVGLMNVRNAPPSPKHRKEDRIEGKHLDFAARLHPWFRAATGHGLYVDRKIKQRYPDSFWFTILREPRARYLSHHGFRLKVGQESESLESWIRRGAMPNLQTTWLVGEPNYDKAVDALENLYDFVGRLDHLEHSLAMMAKAAGIELGAPQGYKANSARDKAPQLTDELMDMVEESNAVDIRLWDYFVANIWPRQIAELGDAKLSVRPEVTIGDRLNQGASLAWRGLVYLPALRVRNTLS